MHNPVLLDETLSALINNPVGLYVDATFGRGGHSQALLDRLDELERVIEEARHTKRCRTHESEQSCACIREGEEGSMYNMVRKNSRTRSLT